MVSTRKCKSCDNPLKRTQRTYCSPECLKAGLQGNNINCFHCGNEFKPIRKSSRYCSLSCFRASSAQARRLEVPQPDPVQGATWIPLTGGEFALVDDADAPLVQQYSWCCVKIKTGNKIKKYAKSTLGENNGVVYMHRFLLGDECEGKLVDHINDGLDNRRKYIRVATASQNATNSKSIGKYSKYKGVSYHFSTNEWICRITKDGQMIRNFFPTEMEAALFYDSQSRILHGEYARLNFPKDGELSALVEDRSPPTLIEQISSRPNKDRKPEKKKTVTHTFIPDGAVLLHLSNGETALIDSDDEEKCSRHPWNICRARPGIAGYPRTRIEGKSVSLHHFVFGEPPEGMVIDHINMDTRDARKVNLRYSTKCNNIKNRKKREGCSSKFLGVKKVKNRWVSNVMVDGHYKYLGYFLTEEQAARARDEYVRQTSGEFGRYNFPNPGEASAL